MRRADKQITDMAEILAIIGRTPVCHLGLCDGGTPYVVPMNFGMVGEKLYLHCATAGRKLDIIRANPEVCVEFAADVELVHGAMSCNWSAKYRSVIGFGTAHIVADPAEINAGLQAVVLHYADHCTDFPPEMLQRITIIRIDFRELTGKKSGY